jgi:hypothetical protein
MYLGSLFLSNWQTMHWLLISVYTAAKGVLT